MGVKKRLEGWQEKMACNCEHRRWGIVTLGLLFMVAGALTEESLSDHDDTTFAQDINKSGDPAKTGTTAVSVAAEGAPRLHSGRLGACSLALTCH